MEPTSIVALITTLIPFATAAIKKIFKTDELGEKKTGWNALLCDASHNNTFHPDFFSPH
jgi:hypothetical protein